MDREAKPGEQYVGVICVKCNTPILLFPDKSKGKLSIFGPGTLQITCPDPNCKNQADYGAEQLGHFQVQQRD